MSIGAPLGAEPQLIERAKKEGTFLLYTSMNTPDVTQLIDGFRQRYPFIAPKSYTTRSAALLERVITEARAGKHFADVIQGNAFTLFLLGKRGHLEPYASPESRSFPDSYRDPAGTWVAAYLQLNVIGYNTKLIPRSEAPKGYEDLLAPKWKGKMGLDDKQYIWFDGLLKVMGREKGHQRDRPIAVAFHYSLIQLQHLVGIHAIRRKHGNILDAFFAPIARGNRVFRDIVAHRLGLVQRGIHDFLKNRLPLAGEKPVNKNLSRIGMGRLLHQGEGSVRSTIKRNRLFQAFGRKLIQRQSLFFSFRNTRHEKAQGKFPRRQSIRSLAVVPAKGYVHLG
jgi:hypothetical protein